MPLRPRSRFSLTFVAFLAALAACSAPGAAADSPSALSAGLAELATPAVAGQGPAGQAAALSLPRTGTGSLERIGDAVVVEAHFEAGAISATRAVKASGARVIDASRRYQTLVLAVAPEDLEALAAVPGISAVTPALRPQVAAVGGSATAAAQSNGLCEGGSVITQGLGQLNVAAARGAFGARGAGETIGVLSNSFNSATVDKAGKPVPTHAHEDEVTNDLPGPASTCSGQQLAVNVIAEDPAGEPASAYTDEGRAMLQVVHDLAPHAKLAFATGEPSEISYAQNIEKLAAPVSAGGAGANVIVDDLSFVTEPFFQDGPVAEAIRRVTEKGVLYFSAAANENLFNPAGEEISSWETPHYRSSTTCNGKVVMAIDEALTEEGKGAFEPDCLDFDPSGTTDTEFGFVVEPGRPALIDLQWAEPRYGVKSDLVAFLVAGSGAEEEVVAGGGETELGIAPDLQVAWVNETPTPQEVQLVIARCAGTCNPAASKSANPRLKFQFMEDGYGVSETEYPQGRVELEGSEDVVGPTIYGHDGAAVVNTVGAVNWNEGTAPQAPEPYSSRGPVTHYFGAVTGITPAAALPTPEVISKPDITATDCASTTFFVVPVTGVPGYEFCGSSEAAEHAATIAALMQQTNPFATPAEIVSRMESTATKFSVVNSPDAVGAGMVNALAAMTALPSSPVDDPPSHVVPSLEEEAAAPPPTVKITKGPKPLGNENRPTFEFSSTRPVTFSCQLDGGDPQPCASPYLVPAKLPDGDHGFVVTGTDAQGRSGSSGIYSFTVDTKAPKTTIVGHPNKVVKTRKRNVVAHFKLRSNEAPVTFYCQIDKEALRICPKVFHHRFAPGAHALKVRAKDEAGNLATKIAVYRFRVKQLRPKRHPRSPRSAG